MNKMLNAKAFAPDNSAVQFAPAKAAVIQGVEINIPTMDMAIDALIGAAKKAETFSCFTLNLDHLVKLRQSSSFREAYKTAKFVTADGAPVAALARRQWSQIERTTGADLFVPLCKAAADHKLPVYFFGTSPETLRATQSALLTQTGGRLQIAGSESPPLGFDAEGPQSDAALERIRASGARLCFVMLGAPKQELMAARAVRAGIPCGFIGVGAAADFIAGTQSRAPEFMQKSGLEWLWRLAHNPHRLIARYVDCALLLAKLTATEWSRSRADIATTRYPAP